MHVVYVYIYAILYQGESDKPFEGFTLTTAKSVEVRHGESFKDHKIQHFEKSKITRSE